MHLAALFGCHAAAWVAALAFLRVAWRRGALVVLLSSSAVLLIQLLLLWQGYPGFEVWLLAAVSLVTALALPELFQIPQRDALTAFCLAQSGGNLLWSCTSPLLLITAMLCVFVVLTAALSPYYPLPDWRELLAAPTAEKDGFRCRTWYPDAFFLILCLAVNIVALLPLAGWTAAAVRILGMLLYWSGVCLLILFINYRRASLAVTSEKEYREEMEKFMNVIRSQRHDYNFHVRTLAGLFRRGELDACRSYLDNLVEDTVEMNQVLPIQDVAISATIFSFRMLAAQEGITLHVDVQNDLSQIVTNVYETNKIISNLLQNAIDEVRTHDDKSYGIWLYILKRGHFCMIHTANQLGDTAVDDKVFRQGYTTKVGHDGVGLSSIKSLAERYHGAIYTRLEDGVIHFVAQIPLRYKAKSGEPSPHKN